MLNKRLDPIIFALLLVSLATNVYLFRRGHHQAHPEAPPLRVGDRVPSLSGLSLNGEPAVVSFEQRPVVLYVFSPKCVWSDRNLENAQSLSGAVETSHDFFAVALDESDLATYLLKNTINWQIVRAISPEMRRAFRFSMTPQTIVVDVGGTVRHVWTGAYNNDIADQVQRTFRITLPGLRSSASGS